MQLGTPELSASIEGGPYLTVSSLRHRGSELLLEPAAVPASYRVHGLRAGITILHPWANRLGPGAVAVDGRQLVLAPGDSTVYRDANGLPLHGLAAPGGWELSHGSERAGRAQLIAPALDAFPFPHRVDVGFEVSGSRLVIDTTVTCTTEVEVPVAFGWHPYFRVRHPDTAEISLPRRDHLALDPTGIPTGASQPESAAVLPVAGAKLDDAYQDIGDGSAFVLLDGELAVEVIHESGFRAAQVFAPPDTPVVSLEPMTAPPDALRTGRGLNFARPGDPFSARFAIQISARALT